MKFGCCATLDQMKMVQQAGFDYIELPVSTIGAESPELVFEHVMDEILSFDIPPEVWHHLLEKDMKVVGPEVDIYRIERYLRTAFARIEELGGEVVVFGSASARTVPDGFTREEAVDQVVDFLSLAGGIAGSYGITIVIEPLGPHISNTITSFHEAAEVCKRISHPFVKVLADLYQMSEMGESTDKLIEVGQNIIHVHTSDTGRKRPGSGSLPHSEFIAALRKAGYDERVSVQCDFDNPLLEMQQSLEYLKSL